MKKTLFVSVGMAALLVCGWSVHAWAQVLPRGAKSPSLAQPRKSAAVSNGAPVINLPAGKKFVQYIPWYTSEATMHPDWGDAFITCDRDPEERPKRYSYAKPGDSLGSWDVKFYIQKH